MTGVCRVIVYATHTGHFSFPLEYFYLDASFAGSLFFPVISIVKN